MYDSERPSHARTRVAWAVKRLGAVLAGRTSPLDAVEALEYTLTTMREAQDEYVVAAALAGVSWADIGRSMGMSRQAARQKYTPRVAARTRELPPSTWIPGEYTEEQWDRMARNAYVAAAVRMKRRVGR